MSIAIGYLFNSKEPGVQEYLGNRLFSFKDEDVDFYVPQLINMYIQMDDIADVIHKYLIQRSRYSVDFALKSAWLLSANMENQHLESQCQRRAARLLKFILSEELRPSFDSVAAPGNTTSTIDSSSSNRKTHHRSKSAENSKSTEHSMSSLHSSALLRAASNSHVASQHAGDLSSGRAFQTDSLTAQKTFIRTLETISKRLQQIKTKEMRTAQLYAELSLLNLNLPAQVFLPTCDIYSKKHYVVRLPHTEATILNSKTKAPYLVHVEILESDLPLTSFSPQKMFIDSEDQEEPAFWHPSEFNGMNSLQDDDCWTTRCSSPKGDKRENLEEEIASRQERASISSDSSESSGDQPIFFSVGDVRRRLSATFHAPKKTFPRDPEDPSASILKEPWKEKLERIRRSSPYGHLPNWSK